jgi:hypothetical protein
MKPAGWATANPIDYLKDLFTRLPAAKITEIGQFTPAAWSKAIAKENIEHGCSGSLSKLAPGQIR